MKIAVNLLYLDNDTKSGIGKHIEDILSGLEKLNVLKEFYLIVQDTFYNNYFCPVNVERPFNNVNVLICPEGRLLRTITGIMKKKQRFIKVFYLSHFVVPNILKDIDFDLVFYPYNEAPNNVSLPYPIVAVIHDLFYKNFPDHKKSILSKLSILYAEIHHRMIFRKANKIVAISEFVKSDIMKHFPGIKSNKIIVIPNAVVISRKTVAPGEIRKPFLLCVSDHGTHKNHLTLLKAFNIIKDKLPHRLVLLGNVREETLRMQSYINENGLRDKVDLISKIQDEERNWFYENADLMISPSMHEGFGRTPVEAAMLGTMVLTSRESSLPEVTYEMLNYYEPATDEKALAEKIIVLLAYPKVEEEREQIAKTFKELYDPTRIAKLYYDLFYDIIHNNK